MSDQDRISRRELFRPQSLGRLLGKTADRTGTDAPNSPKSHPSVGKMMRYAIGAADLPVTTNPRSCIPVLRPPGAVNEAVFLDQCTRCNACIQACPHDAITHAPRQFREAAGTPMINPAQQPCMMCDDTPCVSACEPGVLTSLLPPVMGTARITDETCLAHQGSFCSVCSEHCPVEDAIRTENGKPTVNEDACTGCGVCQHVCPAPENAVLIMPALIRPTAPAPAEPTQGGQRDE